MEFPEGSSSDFEDAFIRFWEGFADEEADGGDDLVGF